LDKTPEALEVVYARIEPYLTILHPTINDTLAKSHEELQETKTEMHKMKGDMGSELLHLNQELREYKTKVNGMAQTLQQLGEMTPFLQKLAKLPEKKLDKLLELLESEE